MINNNFMKNALRALAALSAAAAVACTDDITIPVSQGENGYADFNETSVELSDNNTGRRSAVAVFSEGVYETALKIRLTHPAASAVEIKAEIDPDYLAAWNAENSTSYDLYDTGLVEFADNGTVTIPAGAKEAVIGLTITEDKTLAAGTTSGIPVTVKFDDASITIDKKLSYCMWQVNSEGDVKGADKGEDLPKGFLYFEVNDVNPLNALACQLEDGRLIWDAVCLFAANINHHPEENRPYIKCNENVQFLLDNNETFLQPLRRRGIKVILGLLGNHDQAGLAQLSDQGCKDFAAEVAKFCEAYNLDGVNYDDEYSQSPDLSHPAYTTKSYNAAARLCYETKKAMPDKHVSVFSYGYMSHRSFPTTIEGEPISKWLDCAVPNYGSSTSPVGDLSYKACSITATEFAMGIGGNFTASSAQTAMSQGYGWYMGFALNPKKGGSPTQFWAQLSRVSGVGTLYGSPLAKPTFYYEKNDPTPYPYTGN